MAILESQAVPQVTAAAKLAHEAGHVIGGHHQARNRVLLADPDHVQSAKIDKQLVLQLNHW
jgi:hypothetical protein